MTSYLAQHGTSLGSLDDNSARPLSLLHHKLASHQHNSPCCPPLNILELGCGCGIVGLGLVVLLDNCHVTLTDLPSAESIAVRNIEHSRNKFRGTASFRVYDWDDPISPYSQDQKPPDIILVADCTYNPDSASALVQALVRCVNGSRDTVVVLAHKRRHESEKRFFDIMRERFETVDYCSFVVKDAEGLVGSDGEGEKYDSAVNLYTFRLLLPVS